MSLISRVRFALAVVMYGERKALQLIPTWDIGKPKMLNLNYETLAKEGYAKNELVFSCIRHIAHSAAEPKIKVMLDDDTEAGEEHPLVQLLQHPNPEMSLYDMIEATLTMELIGGVCYWEKERAGVGLPVALWPLRPDRVEVVPSATGVAGYRYRVGTYEKLFPAQDIVRFKWYDPRNEFFGQSPLAVCARAADADNERTDFVRAFFANAGVPYGLLKTKTRMEEAEMARIQKLWKEKYGGLRGWSNLAVLDADAEYQPMGLNMVDMAFPELTRLSEARICMTFGVPPILIGANVGLEQATYSNCEQARKMFWEDQMTPIMRKVEDVLNLSLGKEFGVKILIDLSEIKSLQEDRNSQWQRANMGVMNGWVTVNQAREEAGMDAVPGQDIFLRKADLVVINAATGTPDESAMPAKPEPIIVKPGEKPEEGKKPEDGKKPADEKPKVSKALEEQSVRAMIVLRTKHLAKAVRKADNEAIKEIMGDVIDGLIELKVVLQSNYVSNKDILGILSRAIEEHWSVGMIDDALGVLYMQGVEE